MKYFIPEWDDLVDPNYNFLNDQHSSRHSKDHWENDVRAWEIFGLDKVPFDGVLVSRMTVIDNKEKYQKILDRGIHEFLRLPSSFPIMGDCGAFGYINKEKPPFTSKEMLDYYYKCNFDIGTSIDHLIVKSIKIDGELHELSQKEMEERWNITVSNAKEIYELWTSDEQYYHKFRLMGVIQGWDKNSYVKAAKDLISCGYRYIGFGGLVRSTTKEIEDIIMGIFSTIRKFEKENKERVDTHLFGVIRPRILGIGSQYGLTSFDSASMLRKAWLSNRDNYFHTFDKRYSAIRVHFADSSNPKLKKLEQETLQKLREYDKKKITLDEVIKVLQKYEERTGNVETFMEAYKKTLTDRPWEKCECPICKQLGIEVCIFRGNNRNRRRGFHNTHVFYKYLMEKIPKVLVFTTCAARKNKSKILLPAFKRYMPSPPFKVWWNNVYDLPIVNLGIFSAKYGLIPWWKEIPDYDYKLQEEDITKFVKELTEKMNEYDKIFFHGLGLYRKVVEQVKEKIGSSVEIFPKKELTNRSKIDMIEMMKQVKPFRKEILNYLGFEKSLIQKGFKQATISEFKI